MKHAYLIMAHNEWDMLNKLIQALDYPNNDIYLHIDKKESICFGDSSSDLPMFNACNIKIAMKNGNDEIKQKATYIADDVDDNGVYKMFKQLQII